MPSNVHKKCKVVSKPRNPELSVMHKYALQCGYTFLNTDGFALFGEKVHCPNCCKVKNCPHRKDALSNA